MNRSKNDVQSRVVSFGPKAIAAAMAGQPEAGSKASWTRGVAGVFSMLAIIGACVPAYADLKEDPRDVARVWRLYRNPQLERMWGINILGIRLVSSDWMLQFKYRVTDPEKAKLLVDHQAKPYLTDKTSGAMLAVPAMENIGELRQAASLKAGRNYFVIFGNANKVVQRGSRVNIEIGAFQVEDLVVE